MQNKRYPKLYIRSKNEVAKHISGKNFSKDNALILINDVIKNFDSYWQDNLKYSEPDEDKYVRNAKITPLGKLLKKIDKKILAPYDEILPNFIFGGVKNKNHVKAGIYLLGNKRKRVLLKMDISRFFERVEHERVFHFFKNKCECNKRASLLLANFCCVSFGKKGSNSSKQTIARGFSTSPRLAVWCNLDIFLKLDRLVKKELKGYDPRFAIYVDDIGISASRVSKEKMKDLGDKIKNILEKSDDNQKLPVNDKKTKVKSHEEGIEHLGLKFFRNRLEIGKKTRSKIIRIKNTDKSSKPLKTKLKALNRYKRYVNNSHNGSSR